MKYFYVQLAFVFLLFSACEKATTSQEEEQQVLIEWYETILVLSNTEACEDSVNFAFTPIGSKTCGGPTGYIAYSLSIDTENFLDEVADYTAAQNVFNLKWGIPSNCMIEPMPSGIECINGTIQLIY